MSDSKQARFLELAKRYEDLKEEVDQVRTEMNASMLELGYNITLQDPLTLAVYKIVKPMGTFTYYRDVDYVRTVLEGEVKGSLSKKEAESLGYILSK
jgi:hypothetical protein